MPHFAVLPATFIPVIPSSMDQDNNICRAFAMVGTLIRIQSQLLEMCVVQLCTIMKWWNSGLQHQG